MYFVDVNECKIGEFVCDVNAECLNTLGSYICVCISGYFGDGGNCSKFNTPKVNSYVHICVYMSALFFFC